MVSPDEFDDIVYAARVGDEEEVERYCKLHSPQSFSTVYDEESSNTLASPVCFLTVEDGVLKNTPLHMASANGHLGCVKLIVAHLKGLSDALNARNEAGNTALHWACLNGHKEVVQALVAGGLDPFVKNDAGLDPLFEAESNGKSEVVEWLLSNINYTKQDEDEDEHHDVKDDKVDLLPAQEKGENRHSEQEPYI